MGSLAGKLADVVVVVACVTMSACTDGHTQTTPAPAPVKKEPATKVAPPTPIQVKKVQLGGKTWDHSWDAVIERALPPAMLSTHVPGDVRAFCPRFYQMKEVDKRAFWAYFFQALAGAEAGLNPVTNVRHFEPEVAKRDAVSGQMIHSEGLLQLTYEDEIRYGCDFDWDQDKNLSARDPEKTILQPERNLLCGVKILTNQLISRHKPLLTSASYWSTLHPGTLSYSVFAQQMVNPPPSCGREPRRRSEESPATKLARADPNEGSLGPVQ
jgi:hypothetical protein